MRPKTWMGRLCLALAVVCVTAAPRAAAFDQKTPATALEAREFFLPELYISSQNLALDEVLAQLPNREAWETFTRDRAAAGNDVYAYIDPRSGVATNIVGAFPLIPGTGVGNQVTLADLGARLGRSVDVLDRQAVADASWRFLDEHKALLGVDMAQLGPIRAEPVSDHLWQVSLQQHVNGVPVRDARLVVTVNHGNVVLFGTQTWGAATIRTRPGVDAEKALEIGFAYADGRSVADVITEEPRLEIVPVAPQELLDGDLFAGAVGSGYRHRLVWVFSFQRPPEHAIWEVLVDAHDGELLAFQDTNHYLLKEITGGVYPITSTGSCPNAQNCGSMQSNWPMPWANTGLAAPENYTNSAGLYDNPGATATTTLSGKYVRMSDSCGAISASSTGTIALGGANNQHDCTTPGSGGAGNTPASRSGFYELNKLAEMARGWLANNSWIRSQLTSNMNIASTCNAFWNGSTVNFYRSGGGCRNTGELASVFDHEWGHGIDNYDSGGFMSNSSEGYADIAANLRLQTSCVGPGFFASGTSSCGTASDGGPNRNESATGTHCDTNCSGVRDADYAKHSPSTADTPLNFNCVHCASGTGPCGSQVHCSAAPTRQAAWDFANRDLTAAPFSYDSQTAYMIANKVFYQGSGNVGTWHACTCGSSSNGCGSTNGYMQWLAADDDNGNVNDGTPHMTALYNAFNRHAIACSPPAAVNSGCSGGPTLTPTLTGTAGPAQATLSWDGIPGATTYWILRTEGHAGCNFGKAKIAEVSDETTFIDAPLLPGRSYYYNVVAQGASSACFTKASNCVTVTPTVPPPCNAPGAPSLSSPANGATNVATQPALDWTDVTGAASYDVEVSTNSTFTAVVASANSQPTSNWTVGSPLAFGTLHYWRARAKNDCGALSNWSTSRTFTTCNGPAAPTLSSPASGATNQSLTPLLSWGAVSGATGYEVQVATDSGFTNVVRATSGNFTSWTVSPALSASKTYYWRVRAVTSCGLGAWSSYRSFTTLCVTLQPPLLSSPASGATNQPVDPFLDWADVTSADRYDVQVSTNSGFTTITTSASGLTRSDWSVSPDLAPGTTHYWRARAVNNCSTSNWTSARYFTTCAAPLAPSLTTPYNNSTNIALSTLVDWSNVTGALTYDVEVGSSRSATGLTTSQWTVTPTLSPSTNYSWRARAVNSCAPGPWSTSWTFGTCAAPGTPTHSSPAYGATNQSRSLFLYWNYVTGATAYDVQVATDSSFNNVVRSKNTTGTSWGVTPALNAQTTYYWRIRAYNSCTNGSWSGYRYFVTGN